MHASTLAQTVSGVHAGPNQQLSNMSKRAKSLVQTSGRAAVVLFLLCTANSYDMDGDNEEG